MDKDLYSAMVEGLVQFPSSAASVSVKASAGRLTLKGTAASTKDRDQIHALAKQIAGADNVDCRLAVVTGGPKRGVHQYILGL